MTKIHPGLILILFGFLILILPKKLGRYLSLVGAFLSLGSVFFLKEGSTFVYKFTDSISLKLISIDKFSYTFTLVLCIITVICVIYSFTAENIDFLKDKMDIDKLGSLGLLNGRKAEKAASLIYAGCGIGVVLCGDWISFLFFWELMAIASVLIVYLGGTKDSPASSFRYMVMHLFGGNLLLAGVMAVSLDKGFEITNLTGDTSFGATLILMGILVNCAVFPVHTWVADSYPCATPEGNLFMGSFTTKVAVFALLKVFGGTSFLMIFGGLVSVFAAIMALIENDIRRLLSYHIVSQIGMMVAAIGTGIYLGYVGASLHAFYNIFYKGVLIMVVGEIFYESGGLRKITELGGLRNQRPLLFICFLIASLSIAGFPFTNGFTSKYLIMESLQEITVTNSMGSIASILVILGGVGTWLSITMKINYFAFIKKPKKEIRLCKPSSCRTFAVLLGTLLCIVTTVFTKDIYSFFSDENHNISMSGLYSMHHILEYVILFAITTSMFYLFRERMKAHRGINLDVDWFYRIPLKKLLEIVSTALNLIYVHSGENIQAFNTSIMEFIKNPKRLFGDEYIVSEEERRDKTRTVAELVHILVLFCILALVVIFTIEKK